VEQAKFMGILIIQKAELKNVSTCLLTQAFWIESTTAAMATHFWPNHQERFKMCWQNSRVFQQANLCKFAERKRDWFRN
jgi:hypothetical protein